MFSHGLCKILKNTYFEEHLWTTASILRELLELETVVVDQVPPWVSRDFFGFLIVYISLYSSCNATEALLGKGVLRICNKFTGERPRRSAISIKLQSNFIEITLQHRCSSVNFFREKKLIVSLVELNASFKKPQWNLYKVDTTGAWQKCPLYRESI